MDQSGLDDDGKPKRIGTLWTTSAHIITAVIGSGVLSLAWGVAQLGWIAGVATLAIFSAITLYTANLLADCYRCPNTGKRNYNYMEAVKSNLGGKMYVFCGVVNYVYLFGSLIGYTITASISSVAVFKAKCFHKKGHAAPCNFSANPYIIGIGIIEILLSQIPNFHELSWLSILAAIMSFGYASIGTGLAFAQLVSGEGQRTTMTGIEVGPNLSEAQKVWSMFRAFGCIAFAYTFSQILIEIQDTLRSSPSESKVMKKANMIGLMTTTVFYMMCGCFGYAAFGNNAPGNMLTGFGFFEPFWLIDIANIYIVVHLLGAYQVFAQPIFSMIESWARKKWPKSEFITTEYPINLGYKNIKFNINLFRLTWRSIFVVIVTIFAMGLPFFNDVLAFLGAIGYWPLTVYFPVEMYIAQKKIKAWGVKWCSLRALVFMCLMVALAAACGAIQGLSESLTKYKPFQFSN